MMSSELTNPTIYDPAHPSETKASSSDENSKDAGNDHSAGDRSRTRFERRSTGIDGLSGSFYVDWLANAHESCPRLGIATMLSVTSKIGDDARSFGFPLISTCCNGCGIATACRHHCYVHNSN